MEFKSGGPGSEVQSTNVQGAIESPRLISTVLKVVLRSASRARNFLYHLTGRYSPAELEQFDKIVHIDDADASPDVAQERPLVQIEDGENRLVLTPELRDKLDHAMNSSSADSIQFILADADGTPFGIRPWHEYMVGDNKEENLEMRELINKANELARALSKGYVKPSDNSDVRMQQSARLITQAGMATELGNIIADAVIKCNNPADGSLRGVHVGAVVIPVGYSAAFMEGITASFTGTSATPIKPLPFPLVYREGGGESAQLQQLTMAIDPFFHKPTVFVSDVMTAA